MNFQLQILVHPNKNKIKIYALGFMKALKMFWWALSGRLPQIFEHALESSPLSLSLKGK